MRRAIDRWGSISHTGTQVLPSALVVPLVEVQMAESIEPASRAPPTRLTLRRPTVSLPASPHDKAMQNRADLSDVPRLKAVQGRRGELGDRATFAATIRTTQPRSTRTYTVSSRTSTSTSTTRHDFVTPRILAYTSRSRIDEHSCTLIRRPSAPPATPAPNPPRRPRSVRRAHTSFEARKKQSADASDRASPRLSPCKHGAQSSGPAHRNPSKPNASHASAAAASRHHLGQRDRGGTL